MKKVSINIENLQFSKEITKEIENSGTTKEQFINDAKRYINAINEGRMFCVIYRISSSGMSRNLSFQSCETDANNGGYWFSNYNCLFKSLGYKEAKEGFRIGGCGVNMIFDTNYSIIHDLKRIGLIDKESCDILAQKTPTTF